MANVDAAHHGAKPPWAWWRHGWPVDIITSNPAPGASSGGRDVGELDVADDEKTKWAIDVMTAWAQGDADGGFLHDRIDVYTNDTVGRDGLVVGLINLAGLLLSGMETVMGRSADEILRAIGSTIALHDVPPPTWSPPGDQSS